MLKKVSTVYYKEIDSTGINEVDYFKIYDVFLSKFKGICYNEAEEMDAMLSLLTANSYEEMIRIANGNKEALDIVEELKDVSYYVDYFGAYKVEEEQKRREKTARTFGYKEGVEEGKLEGIEEGRKEAKIEMAKNFIKNKVDLEVISSSTGLTIEELKELQKHL